MNIRNVGGLALCAAVLSCAPAFAQTKVAIINMEEAIARTQEGQRLMQQFQKELEDLQTEIQGLQNQLTNGANTLSDEARRDLSFRIEQKQTEGQRMLQDARGEVNQEQGKIFNDVGSKVVAVIDKYAQANGYTVVLNISAQPNLVLFALNEINITQAIIDAYDAANPAAPAAGGAE
jgi:Skp family chaperone for outer membrane proteins